MNKDTIVLLSGGFDPVHSGHIKMINAAKKLKTNTFIIVGVNSDNWLARKKGKAFLPLPERLFIMNHIKYVDLAVSFNDDDDTATDLIRDTINMFDTNNIIFANGGDRTITNIPEMLPEFNDRVKFEFGVGGTFKANSSSSILRRWKSNE